MLTKLFVFSMKMFFMENETFNCVTTNIIITRQPYHSYLCERLGGAAILAKVSLLH